MSRYIDADAIEDKAKQYSLGYYEEDEWAVPFKEITSAPSIDIVRCGECKHENNCEHQVLLSTMWNEVEDTADIEYCSYGEREGE